MRIVVHALAWEDYLHWQSSDRKMLKKLNGLIRECTRTPFTGTGKPEPLKNEFQGWWSRRIDQEHRLVYRVRDEMLEIAQCRYHY
jgi:toxin YoeB